MPAIIFNEQLLIAGATEDFVASLYDYLDQPLVIQGTDVVRFKLALVEGGPLALDVDSIAALTGGSVVTITSLGSLPATPAAVTIRLGQADTVGLAAARYFAELGLVDDSEVNPANAYKVCGRGTFRVRKQLGGDLGLT